MSAYNWAICPKCLKEKSAEKAKRLKEAEDAYGKVSKGDYFRLLGDANNYIVPACDTFCEDYEIGIRDGKFSVSYLGKCRKCGFKKEFTHNDR